MKPDYAEAHHELGLALANTEQMSEAIRQLGREEGVPVIDIHSATAAHPEFFASDGVHANPDGLKFIAELACRAILDGDGTPRSRQA